MLGLVAAGKSVDRPATSASSRAILTRRASNCDRLLEYSEPVAVLSSRTSAAPRFTSSPVLTNIASTMPPSRLETTCNCELGMTRPWPRTVRSSSVTDAHMMKIRTNAAMIHKRMLDAVAGRTFSIRSEEHTSELQSLMRISYAVFCLKKKIKEKNYHNLCQIIT